MQHVIKGPLVESWPATADPLRLGAKQLSECPEAREVMGSIPGRVVRKTVPLPPHLGVFQGVLEGLGVDYPMIPKCSPVAADF